MKETDEDTVVAVTRDGRVYLGKMSKMSVQSKIFRHKYLARLLMWVWEASYFIFVRILRFPWAAKK